MQPIKVPVKSKKMKTHIRKHSSAAIKGTISNTQPSYWLISTGNVGETLDALPSLGVGGGAAAAAAVVPGFNVLLFPRSLLMPPLPPPTAACFLPSTRTAFRLRRIFPWSLSPIALTSICAVVSQERKKNEKKKDKNVEISIFPWHFTRPPSNRFADFVI